MSDGPHVYVDDLLHWGAQGFVIIGMKHSDHGTTLCEIVSNIATKEQTIKVLRTALAQIEESAK
jgi:hypothetical protein